MRRTLRRRSESHQGNRSPARSINPIRRSASTFFYGPDEAQSRALAQRLLTGLGAAKSVITGGAVKSDPALLADEAGAMSLFGGKRLIWIEPAGDEILAGVRGVARCGCSGKSGGRDRRRAA